MAIKDYITSLESILQSGQITQQSLATMNSNIAALKVQADALLNAHEAVKTQAKLNRTKADQHASKILQYQDLQNQLSVYKSKLQELDKYRQTAIDQKKQYNERIKSIFAVKMANKSHKDNQKYTDLYGQFDFDSSDQSVLDSNKKKFELLQLAGTFGQTERIVATLPKTKAQSKAKKQSWRDRLK